MLQRVQSIYLFIAGLALALMFSFPISNYYGELHVFRLTLLKLENLVPSTESIFQTYFTLPLIVLVCLIALLALLTIFHYKNRKRQLWIIKIDILLNIILIVGIFIIYSKLILSQVDVDEEYKVGAFLPLFSLIFLVMAYRAVKKDEELVRSADRLR